MLQRSKYSHFAMQFEARCRHPTITCERLTKVKKKSASSAVVYKFQAAQSLKAMSMSGSLIENDSRSCTLASIATHRGLRFGSFWFIVGRPALGSVWLASDLSPAMLLFRVIQPAPRSARRAASPAMASRHVTRAAIGQPPIVPPLTPFSCRPIAKPGGICQRFAAPADCTLGSSDAQAQPRSGQIARPERLGVQGFQLGFVNGHWAG